MNNPAAKYTTGILVAKIAEGRTRVCSLCRLIFGNDSLEYLKSKVDLANIYAVQGMWPQVREHLTTCELLLSKHESDLGMSRKFSNETCEKLNLAIIVRRLYREVRKHASNNKGLVVLSKFLSEVEVALTESDYPSTDHIVDEILCAGASKVDNCQWGCDSIDFVVKRAKATFELLCALKTYFDSAGSINIPYLQVISFLRKECDLVMKWQRDIESLILPQSRAAIEVAFELVDQDKKGLVHVKDLAASLNTCISATRIVSGEVLLQKLLSARCDLSISTDITEYVYCPDELPANRFLTLEEALSTYLIEISIGDPMNHLRLQVKILQGVTHMFTGKLAEAEIDMKVALHILGVLRSESEMIACK